MLKCFISEKKNNNKNEKNRFSNLKEIKAPAEKDRSQNVYYLSFPTDCALTGGWPPLLLDCSQLSNSLAAKSA